MGTGDNRSLPGDSIVFEPGSRTLERIEENLDTPDVDPAGASIGKHQSCRTAVDVARGKQNDAVDVILEGRVYRCA
jgi:hypothetical protein